MACSNGLLITVFIIVLSILSVQIYQLYPILFSSSLDGVWINQSDPREIITIKDKIITGTSTSTSTPIGSIDTGLKTITIGNMVFNYVYNNDTITLKTQKESDNAIFIRKK